MQWRNGRNYWGLSAVLLHWLVALTVFGLFALGWWMTDLDYYDAYYKQGPFIHKSIGVILLVTVTGRLLWRWLDTAPEHMSNHAPWERKIARFTHGVLYLLLLIIIVSGYLISTADGRAVSVFGWFDLPATLQGLEGQEDIAGTVHWVLACTIMAMTAMHFLGALKHQIIDRDGTITRMLGRAPRS